MSEHKTLVTTEREKAKSVEGNEYLCFIYITNFLYLYIIWIGMDFWYKLNCHARALEPINFPIILWIIILIGTKIYVLIEAPFTLT